MSVPDVAPLLEGEPLHDQVVFATRLERYWPDLLTGLSGAYPEHAPEMARRLVVIADNTKWGVVGLSQIADLDAVSTLVTDDKLPQAAVSLLRDRVGELAHGSALSQLLAH